MFLFGQQWRADNKSKSNSFNFKKCLCYSICASIYVSFYVFKNASIYIYILKKYIWIVGEYFEEERRRHTNDFLWT